MVLTSRREHQPRIGSPDERGSSSTKNVSPSLAQIRTTVELRLNETLERSLEAVVGGVFAFAQQHSVGDDLGHLNLSGAGGVVKSTGDPENRGQGAGTLYLAARGGTSCSLAALSHLPRMTRIFNEFRRFLTEILQGELVMRLPSGIRPLFVACFSHCQNLSQIGHPTYPPLKGNR